VKLPTEQVQDNKLLILLFRRIGTHL